MTEIIMKWLTIRRIIAASIVVVTIVGLISLTQVEAWDGGFKQAEFRIRFVDSSGRPVQGIKLAVNDASGKHSYCYPVPDYHEDSTPTTGGDGVMVFHHINLSPEYSGKVAYLFFLIPIGNRSPPVYYCQFSKQGELLCEVMFNDYFGYSNRTRQEWSQLPKSRTELKTMNLVCHSTVVADHLIVQNRQMEEQVVFPVIEKTIELK
jgi:hypothetical protein